MCIGSDGAVDSVQLVTDTPLDTVRTIAATSQSATSATLCRALLPQAALVAEDAPRRCAPADRRRGAALRARGPDPPPRSRRSCGASAPACRWSSRSGPRARTSRPSASQPSTTRCAAAVVEASENARQVAVEAAARFGFPAGFLARYFDRLRYRFGERERAGLERFYQMAAAIGAVETAPPLRFADAALPVS